MIDAVIESIIQATPKIKVFKLRHNRPDYLFKPGQWVDLYAPIQGKNIGGYTIISAPQTSGSIELAIRESAHHPVTQFMHSASVGTKVQITMGQGKFFLSDELSTSGKFVFIAGGIGVTPILSMIRSLDHKASRVQLFYSASLESDFLFQEELAPFTTFIVTKDSHCSGETQRVSLDLLKKYRADLSSHFFICGPKGMIDSLRDSLLSAGVEAGRIHFEKWW